MVKADARSPRSLGARTPRSPTLQRQQGDGWEILRAEAFALVQGLRLPKRTPYEDEQIRDFENTLNTIFLFSSKSETHRATLLSIQVEVTKTMVGAKGTVIELLCGVLTMCKRGALGPSASPFLFDDIVLTLDVLSHQRTDALWAALRRNHYAACLSLLPKQRKGGNKTGARGRKGGEPTNCEADAAAARSLCARFGQGVSTRERAVGMLYRVCQTRLYAAELVKAKALGALDPSSALLSIIAAPAGPGRGGGVDVTVVSEGLRVMVLEMLTRMITAVPVEATSRLMHSDWLAALVRGLESCRVHLAPEEPVFKRTPSLKRTLSTVKREVSVLSAFQSSRNVAKSMDLHPPTPSPSHVLGPYAGPVQKQGSEGLGSRRKSDAKRNGVDEQRKRKQKDWAGDAASAAANEEASQPLSRAVSGGTEVAGAQVLSRAASGSMSGVSVSQSVPAGAGADQVPRPTAAQFLRERLQRQGVAEGAEGEEDQTSGGEAGGAARGVGADRAGMKNWGSLPALRRAGLTSLSRTFSRTLSWDALLGQVQESKEVLRNAPTPPPPLTPEEEAAVMLWHHTPNSQGRPLGLLRVIVSFIAPLHDYRTGYLPNTEMTVTTVRSAASETTNFPSRQALQGCPQTTGAWIHPGRAAALRVLANVSAVGELHASIAQAFTAEGLSVACLKPVMESAHGNGHKADNWSREVEFASCLIANLASTEVGYRMLRHWTDGVCGLTEALLHPLRTATPPLLDPADGERIPAHRPSMTTRALLTPRIPPARDAGESLSAQKQRPLTDGSRSPATKTMSRSLASDSLPGRSTDSIPAQTSRDAVASTSALAMSGVRAGAGGDAGDGRAPLPKLRLGLLTARARSPPLMIDGSQSDRLWECGNVPSKDAAWYVASYGDRIRPLNVSSPLSSSLAGHRCIGVLGRGSWTPRAQAGRAMSNVMKQRLRSASWKPIDLC